MRNVFLFIRRFSVFIAFVILQITSLYMLFSYNRFHKAKGIGVAAAVTGFFNQRYNAVEDFFRMKEENRRVHAMNDSLMNLLRDNFVNTDTGAVMLADSVLRDSAGKSRHFLWRQAQVLYNTVNSDKNYLQINRGAANGITEDMGVFASNGGLVGKVVQVGNQFSQVMTLLHVMNKMSVQMKKTGTAGILSWNGETPTELTLGGIPKTDSVQRGDTVLTGNYSLSFPPGKMVGTVSRVLREEATNFLVLKIRPTAPFGSLQQVFVVENMNMAEQKTIDAETRLRVDRKTEK